MTGYTAATTVEEFEEICNLVNEETKENFCYGATEQITYQKLMQAGYNPDEITMEQDEDIDGTLIMWVKYISGNTPRYFYEQNRDEQLIFRK